MSILKLKTAWRPLVGIALTAGLLLLAFAWVSGRLSGGRVTTHTLFAALDKPDPFPPGFRRAHGKGICFAGTFRPTLEGAELSSARVFRQAETTATGRFSIGHGDPFAPDFATRTISLAMLLATDDAQQWRIALNNVPFFPTRSPEGFRELVLAFRPDPATGAPDAAKVEAFMQAYPEAAKIFEWGANAPWADSFANAEYNSVNAFIFVNEQGVRQPVRWVMRPHPPFREWTVAQREAPDAADHLERDLYARLAKGSLYFDMLLSLAEPGDPVDDPSQPWPEQRRKVVAGTLEVSAVHEQATGNCRDINYDPTIVPPGIEISNDPVLAARSGAYSLSYNLRQREIGYGRADERAVTRATAENLETPP